jgi:hypothetical protein
MVQLKSLLSLFGNRVPETGQVICSNIETFAGIRHGSIAANSSFIR